MGIEQPRLLTGKESDMNKEELKKCAQEKLAAARAMIREAGALAKEGQFVLHFGEIGTFIPSSIDDREALRAQALEILKRDGMNNGYDVIMGDPEFPHGKYVDKPPTPFESLTKDEVENEVEKIADDLIDETGIDREDLEYSDRDTWWHPSRC